MGEVPSRFAHHLCAAALHHHENLTAPRPIISPSPRTRSSSVLPCRGNDPPLLDTSLCSQYPPEVRQDLASRSASRKLNYLTSRDNSPTRTSPGLQEKHALCVAFWKRSNPSFLLLSFKQTLDATPSLITLQSLPSACPGTSQRNGCPQQPQRCQLLTQQQQPRDSCTSHFAARRLLAAIPSHCNLASTLWP